MKCPKCESKRFSSQNMLMNYRVEWIEGSKIEGFSTKPYFCMQCDCIFIIIHGEKDKK